MFRTGSVLLFSLLSLLTNAQKGVNNKKAVPEPENSLLWKIEGNGLAKPSYLFGTIHMICKDDAILSDSMKAVIRNSDVVYFEMDLDNVFEMLSGLGKLKMRGDTTLKDLLSPAEYARVKDYFGKKSTLLPFSVLETYKPIMASSMLSEGEMPCDGAVSMEQLIMTEAKGHGKKIKGLETMNQQSGFLDSIPYKYQAAELLKYVDSSGNDGKEDETMNKLFEAYRNQDLKALEALMVDGEAGMNQFSDILLYNRNRNWVAKLKTLMGEKMLLIAVGAGHLPGEKGVINLLRKAGYKVSPVNNKTTSAII